MLTDNGNIVINPKPANDTEDYELLRKTGLSYIQQFSGKLWTDYNVHDPGITILELLCYALTDLAYRTSFPVADLLTAPGAKGPNANDFYTARKILTVHPITVNDYRKLIMDRIPGVRNVWMETMDDTNYTPNIYFDKVTVTTTLQKPPVHAYEILQLKGLYSVRIEAEDFETLKGHHPHYLRTLARYRDKDSLITGEEAGPTEYKTCLANYVKTLLLESRNLCEDFEVVQVANDEWVALCADIELKSDANADEVFKQIFSRLYNYINPPMKFHSFKELIDKGRRTEDIFNGPAAVRGFIDEQELNEHGHKDVLYVSDIINLLMDIDGILQIKTIHLTSYKESNGNYTIIENAQPYCLHLKDKVNSAFQFMMDAEEQDKKKIFNHIRFSKGPIYFSPKRKESYEGYEFISYPRLPKNFVNDLPIPTGKYRNLPNYNSVQNDFPLTYYTGMDGIPNGESNLRKAQRLQSKAFLLFFDQLLADYLAQLNNLKKTFTWRGDPNTATLLASPLNETLIKDLRKILTSSRPKNEKDAAFFKDTYAKYSEILETPKQQNIRRNKMLDHLLARFNELFVDYSVFRFQQNKEGDFFSDSATDEVIKDKMAFLTVYPIISGRRSHAINYTKETYYSSNISGLQLRLQKMMGITSSENRHLVVRSNNVSYKTLLKNIIQKKQLNQPPDASEKLEVHDNRFSPFEDSFGVHVLEHILLRPLYQKATNGITSLLPLCGDGTDNQHADCLLPDYYSMQMTVALPGWLSISSNMDFRVFTENLIRTEAPAHVALKICWLNPARMYIFEKTTQELFKQMAKVKAVGVNPPAAAITAYNKALQDVYSMMGILKNMYPVSNLDKCENINYNAETDTIKTPIILNYSALGTNPDEEWYAYKKPILMVNDKNVARTIKDINDTTLVVDTNAFAKKAPETKAADPKTTVKKTTAKKAVKTEKPAATKRTVKKPTDKKE